MFHKTLGAVTDLWTCVHNHICRRSHCKLYFLLWVTVRKFESQTIKVFWGTYCGLGYSNWSWGRSTVKGVSRFCILLLGVVGLLLSLQVRGLLFHQTILHSCAFEVGGMWTMSEDHRPTSHFKKLLGGRIESEWLKQKKPLDE